MAGMQRSHGGDEPHNFSTRDPSGDGVPVEDSVEHSGHFKRKQYRFAALAVEIVKIGYML